VKQGQFDQTKKINPQRLHEEIKTALGDKLVSMNTGERVKVGFLEKTCIMIAVTDDITEADNVAVQAVIDAHDPEVKSAGQQHNEKVATATQRLSTVDFDAEMAKAKSVDARIELLLSYLKDVQLYINGERTD
jgi:transcriptional/translational regulatory protein YebC/TACO1